MILWLAFIEEYSAQIVLLLLAANLLLIIINCIWMTRAYRRISLVEFKFSGLSERIRDTNHKFTQVTGEIRRITGKFDQVIDEELSHAATRIRERIEPELKPGEEDIPESE